MTLASEIMGGGLSAGAAQAINGPINPSVSAAGTTISDATSLTAGFNLVTTVGSGAGVKLPNALVNDVVSVYNKQGSNALLIYPPTSGATINQLSAGTAVSLASWTLITFKKVAATEWIAWLSA